MIPRFSLDAIDMKILAELQEDASLSNVDLAQRVGLTPSPCLTRTRALEAAGYILRRVALIDPHMVGAEISVFIHVTLERQIDSHLDRFERAIADFTQVMECYLMTGDSDYLLRVVVADVFELQEFIVGKLSKIPGVANIRSSFALKQIKYKTALPIVELQGAAERRLAPARRMEARRESR